MGEADRPGAVPSLALRLARDRAQAVAALEVPRETEDRLARVVDTLLRWQQVTHLVAPSTVPALWTRHIADSLQLQQLAPAARRIVDLGSGRASRAWCWPVR